MRQVEEVTRWILEFLGSAKGHMSCRCVVSECDRKDDAWERIERHSHDTSRVLREEHLLRKLDPEIT